MKISAGNLNDFELESTTVWSFPERGKWCTHNSSFRGNFAPQIPRNLILKYSSPGDIILDPMVGGGTTLIEAKLLNRNAIGIDINPDFVELTKKNLNFHVDNNSVQKVYVGNALNLYNIKSQSIDLIITHPPYANIIKYSNGRIKGDLSNISSIQEFCDEFEIAIKEFYRVLKPNKYCCILIGDTRRKKHYVPLSFFVLERFFRQGFILKEDIIKIQHNCSTTNPWKLKVKKYDFYLIMHEHLFIFRKPDKNEDLSIYRDSTKIVIKGLE
ncbi:TRM11 family SAM-dependent methyltransferase [Thermoanaerobacterium sp. DL9XJH110]|uniref:TRM11 family SAM-dependent methyltransferase n=1 Tax=Thermoanaerobacterium sp. DL9XJH110 TaxID=3386643 RepID=UPI003BB6E20F